MTRKKSAKKIVEKNTMMQSLIKEAVAKIGRGKPGDKNYQHLKELRQWCEEHKHPEARMIGQGEHPINHLYCELCNAIFYNTKHPAYRSAKGRGEIDDSYES